MGSWSMTCAFTGLPVNCGDEARIILLGRDPQGLNGGAMCDFTPASAAIKGAYDDYGFVEALQPGPLAELLCQQAGFPTVEQWLEAAKEGSWEPNQRESRADRLGASVPITFTLVLEEAWQRMLELPQEFALDYKDYNNKISAAELIEGAAREVVAWARGLSAKKAHHKALNSFEGESESDTMELFWLIKAYEPFNETSHASALFGRTFWNSYNSALAGDMAAKNVWAAIADNPEAYSDEQLCGIVRELGEICLVTHAMYSVRKRWEPAPSGPQSGMIANHWLWERSAFQMAEARFAQLAQENDASSYDENFSIAQATRESDALAAQTPKAPKGRAKNGI